MVNKLISVWWTRRNADMALRRQIVKLQRFGLPPEAASEALQILNRDSQPLSAWLAKWMSIVHAPDHLAKLTEEENGSSRDGTGN